MNKLLNNITGGIQNLTGTTTNEKYVIKFPKTASEYGVDLNRKFDKNCWIATHNSHANRDQGFVYYQQTFDIKEQLEKVCISIISQSPCPRLPYTSLQIRCYSRYIY
jgi:hypothetical protein